MKYIYNASAPITATLSTSTLPRGDYQINILCTDAYPLYGKYSISNQHVVTKAETSLVESKNSLARFNRETKKYSKAFDMIENSLLLLFNKELILSIIS